MPTNKDDMNEQTLFTQAVEATMETVREHYSKIMLYINLTWPDDKTIAQLCGSKLYEKARNSTLKMISLMRDAYIDADSATYQADLIASGFIQADIDLFDTLAGELMTKNRVHEKFMRLSYTSSEVRVVAFNKVWDPVV